jgi:hypothetical protein
MSNHELPLGPNHPDACKACCWYHKTDKLDLCAHCLEAYDKQLATINHRIIALEQEFHIPFVRPDNNKQG